MTAGNLLRAGLLALLLALVLRPDWFAPLFAPGTVKQSDLLQIGPPEEGR